MAGAIINSAASVRFGRVVVLHVVMSADRACLSHCRFNGVKQFHQQFASHTVW